MTEKYKITEATMVTYSGRHVKVAVETDYVSYPIKMAKELLLEAFHKCCKDAKDPIVKVIHLKVKHLFDNYDRSNNHCPNILRVSLAPKEDKSRNQP